MELTNRGVTEIENELLRLYVDSDEEGAPPYLVDLEPFDGNGDCPCKHFQIRLRPILERGENGGHPIRCKHLIRARAYLLDSLINRMRKTGMIHKEMTGP